MTNESIFYIIGVVLGAILGYALRALIEPNHSINIVLSSKENTENEQRDS